MKGFIVDYVDVELSDERVEKIDVRNHEHEEPQIINGQKYIEAVARIKLTSTGDVSDITQEQLLKAINEQLDLVIKFD